MQFTLIIQFILILLSGVACHNKKDDPAEVQATLFKSTQLWPYGVVPYKFKNNVKDEDKEMIKKVMNEVESLTEIKFMPIKEAVQAGFRKFEWRYLIIEQEELNGITSGIATVGYYKYYVNAIEFEIVSLSNIRHELMHTLGFVHEHTHPSAKVNLNVVLTGAEADYQQKNIKPPHAPFDPDSVTLYSSTDLSICFPPRRKRLFRKEEYVLDRKWKKLPADKLPPRECIVRASFDIDDWDSWLAAGCHKKCATHLTPDGEVIPQGLNLEFSSGDIKAINRLYRKEISKRKKKFGI